jgi:hypothetical protein
MKDLECRTTKQGTLRSWVGSFERSVVIDQYWWLLWPRVEHLRNGFRRVLSSSLFSTRYFFFIRIIVGALLVISKPTDADCFKFSVQPFLRLCFFSTLSPLVSVCSKVMENMSFSISITFWLILSTVYFFPRVPWHVFLSDKMATGCCGWLRKCVVRGTENAGSC